MISSPAKSDALKYLAVWLQVPCPPGGGIVFFIMMYFVYMLNKKTGLLDTKLTKASLLGWSDCRKAVEEPKKK